MLGNKKGDIIYPIVIFIVLNIVFFATILIFVTRSTSGAGTYEQLYAKEIALVIDGAKPGTEVFIDMSNAIELVKKLQKEKEGAGGFKILEEAVKIDKTSNKITVNILGNGGYSFRYFSGYDVSVGPISDSSIVITVKEKKINGGALA